MSDFDDDLDGENTEGQESPTGLRRAANKAKRLEQENTQLQRELAFARAGIVGDDARTNIFIRGYDGDLDPDKIRSVAVEAGFIQQAPDPQAQQNQQAAEAQAQAQALTPPSGQVVAGSSPEERLEQAMTAGGVEAMFAEARNMGIPFTYDGQ